MNRTIPMILLLAGGFLALSGRGFAQGGTDATDTAKAIPPTSLEKVMYLAGASLLYAGIDFVGYNLSKGNGRTLLGYRIFQLLMQAGITCALYELCGLPTAASFNLLWWSFGLDILYYGYAEAVNAGGDWERRGNFRANVMGNKATWAYWTPVGISRGMKRSEPIAGSTLVAQSLVGLGIALTITIAF